MIFNRNKKLNKEIEPLRKYKDCCIVQYFGPICQQPADACFQEVNQIGVPVHKLSGCRP